MNEDRTDDSGKHTPANENDPSAQSHEDGDGDGDGDANVSDAKALRRIDDVVLQLARLIGRRMAREDFAARIAKAANDNTPTLPDDRAPS